jgi:predicted membrane protein
MRLYAITIIKILLALVCAAKFTETYSFWYLIVAIMLAVRWTFTLRKGKEVKKYYM